MRAATQLQPAKPWEAVDAVAAHIGIARVPVVRWIDEKRLPAHRGRKLWKFKLGG
ncbi:hypothetical protein NR800_37065 [Corallococcus interemptor]|uniref:hypothetical protein n=1 Tax=Corallococcus interemptor TaxID=2316720 RepID=UPI0035D3DF50